MYLAANVIYFYFKINKVISNKRQFQTVYLQQQKYRINDFKNANTDFSYAIFHDLFQNLHMMEESN